MASSMGRKGKSVSEGTEMGFGDGLNWMNEKPRQSVPDMTAATEACQGSYDLGRYACEKMREGAEKLIEKLKQSVPDRTAVTKACEDSYNLGRYACEKMNEGAEKLMKLGRATAPILNLPVRPPAIDVDATEEESKKMNEKQEAGEGRSLLSKQSKLVSEMIMRIEEDKHMLMKRIEKLEDDNKLLRSELNKSCSKQTENSSSKMVHLVKALRTHPFLVRFHLAPGSLRLSTWRICVSAMAAWAAAAAAARQAAFHSRLSSPASPAQAARLFQRRGLAGGADPHGPPKINLWQDPMSPSKWKEEHFVIASLTGWGLLIFGGYKAFSGGKKEKTEEKQQTQKIDSTK
ncbi:hypothetical protein ACLOJK_041873 [Asimina triloba]